MSPDRRKVILGCGMSLDGYIARPDGSFDFLDMGLDPKDFEKAMAGFYKKIDTIVMGRGTLEAMERMTAGGGADEAPPGPWKTYVLSRTLPPGERNGARIVRESPARFIGRIRRNPGKHILHMGGGKLARSFLEADLIDEIYLGIVPVLVGAGIPLFPSGFPQREFKLIECERFSKDHASLRYGRVRPKPAKKARKKRPRAA